MPVSVIGITQARMAQAALGGHLDGDRLLMLLDGAGSTAGVLSVDRSSLSAIIQQQTMGQITGADPGDRPYTGTDAAMVAPLADAMLARATELLAEDTERMAIGGFRFGARALDIRALLLALDAEQFRVFDLTLDFAGGVRQGSLCLALPELEQDTGRVAAVEDPDRMKRAVGAARAELRAVIGHIQLPLSELPRMRPGNVLPLVEQQLARADLIAIDGTRVISARLGQAGGLRAVRLNEVSAAQAASSFEPGVVSPAGKESETDTTMPALSLAAPQIAADEVAEPLPEFDPEDAAAEISELAGLPMNFAELEEDPSWSQAED